MKIRFSLTASLIAFAALSCAACATPADDTNGILLDPLSGEPIGFIDETTGDYHLDALDVAIEADSIERTWVDEATISPGVDIQANKCVESPGQLLCPDNNGGMCWVMDHRDSTQEIHCEGCCVNIGTGWWCWESCTDRQVSSRR